MMYKTMVLELLQQRTQLHAQLRKQRMLLTTLERLAGELKASHEAWKDRLSQARPGSDPSQIASEALEIALRELEDSLPPESPQNEDEPLSLDAAMAFLRRHTPPA
jgi:hypothetical protein